MKKAILCSAIIFTSAANASVLEPKWYVKAGYGMVDPDAIVVEEFVADTIEEEVDTDAEVSLEVPRGQNISLGYRLNHYIAFEAGYSNFGKSKDKHEYIMGANGSESKTFRTEVSGSTGILAAVLSTDTSKPYSGGIRLGYHAWKTKTRVDYTHMVSGTLADDSAQLLSTDEDGQDAFYGAFINWRIDQWTYSLEHTLYPTDNADITMSTLSLSMDF
ncbi:outer membrane beta-barrel protein [Microbulbifer rhizosphaerae]|uniref:Outer membrane protein beta-barrel domain-containing protein n=1 Tax=Microbulbifer rhizosphaerae TaxID=1562603 RepID=A0A7W4WAD5_9GAMM|nr:outer membrane beta-barrel protein [Microbulbifer rhizosphaerae]MBB3060616.1 hypothetical protein [Microbulbifer rhizosphaerae]